MKIVVENNCVVGHVDISATPDRVFDALCHTQRWWGTPGQYKVTRSEVDLRVGGDWISEGEYADGKPFAVVGKVVAVDPPTLLSMTWNPSYSPKMRETTVTYRLEPIEGGTRMHLTHGPFAEEDVSQIDTYKNGWPSVLGNLKAHAE